MLLTVNFLIILLCLNFQGLKFSVIPKFVHEVNGLWFSFKDHVNEMYDCITLKRKPTLEDVQFYLFTSKNKESPEEIKALHVNKSKNFNDKFFTKILIHGYTQSYKNELFIKMKDVYVATEIFNVIMVNWENLAYGPCYPNAADYTGFVGQLTGYLLAKLLPEKVHIIGFSLGAHVGGLAGQMQKKKILRITGLDPAAPMFFNNPESKRLDKGGAKNVDIMHTSRAGIGGIMGHADFIVNGGKVQPSCSTTNVTCSHRRSLELYLESITSNVGFKATMCDSLNNFETDKCSNNTFTPMGEPWLASGALRGTFYINTNSTAPYALDEQKKEESSKSNSNKNIYCGCLAVMYKTKKKNGNKVSFDDVSQTGSTTKEFKSKRFNFWSRKNNHGKKFIEIYSDKDNFDESSLEISTSTSFTEKLFYLYPFWKLDSKSDLKAKSLSSEKTLVGLENTESREDKFKNEELFVDVQLHNSPRKSEESVEGFQSRFTVNVKRTSQFLFKIIPPTIRNNFDPKYKQDQKSEARSIKSTTELIKQKRMFLELLESENKPPKRKIKNKKNMSKPKSYATSNKEFSNKKRKTSSTQDKLPKISTTTNMCRDYKHDLVFRCWSDFSVKLHPEEKLPCNNRGKQENFHIQEKKTIGDEENSPDIYRRILGSTPNESILATLQLHVDTCSKSDILKKEKASEKHTNRKYLRNSKNI